MFSKDEYWKRRNNIILSETQKILREIKFYLAFFIFAFVIYIGVIMGVSQAFFKETRAFHQCVKLDDGQFDACYKAAKK